MKINKLALKNFVNHEDTCLDLHQSKIHIFVGNNDQGKSAILDAISYGLTGYARDIAEKKDQHLLIRHGNKSGEVSLNLNNLTILRHRTPSGETLTITPPEDKPQVGAAVQDTIYRTLQTTPEVLNCLLNHSNLVDLPAEELKALIFRILNIQVTTESIKNKLLKKGISVADVEKTNDIINLAAAQGFETAEQEAVMRRRVAKRERDNLEEISVPDKMFNLDGKAYDLASLDIETINKNLKSLKENREKLLEEKGKVKALAASAQLAGPKKELEDQIQRLKAEVHQMDKSTIMAKISQIKQDIHKLNERQIKLVSEKSSLQEKMLALDSNRRSDNDTCPRYNINCPIEQKEKERLYKTLIEETNKLKYRYDSVLNSLDQIGKELAGKNKAFEDCQADLTKVNITMEQLTQTEQTYSKILKQQPATHTTGQQKSLEEIETELKQLAARIDKGERLLRATENYKTNFKKQAAISTKTQSLAQEISLWDQSAKAFNPKNGIMGEIIQEALSPVYHRFQKIQHLLDKPITFDDNFNILVNGQPAKTLSGSGKLRTSIILKDALCQAAGLRFFVEDEINLLDQNNKAILVKTLLSLSDDYDTIILCAAMGESVPKPSPDPRIQMWLVKDGQVRQIKDTREPATLNA